jgi:exopolysaccharide biosynthesis polyprenyl glycosylphosphotransferase
VLVLEDAPRTVHAGAQGDDAALAGLRMRQFRVGSRSPARSEGADLQQVHRRVDLRSYRMHRALALGDSVAITTAIFLVVEAGQWIVPALQPASPGWLIPIGIGLWLAIGAMVGAFHLDDRRIDTAAADEVGRIVQGTALWTWAVFLLVAILGGTQAGGPVVAVWIVTIPLMLLARHLVRSVVRRYDWYFQKTVIVGTTADICRVERLLIRHPEYPVKIAGTVEVTSASNDAGRVRALNDEVERTDADRVIFASQYEGLDERTGAMRYLSSRGIKVDLLPGDSEVFRSDAEIHFVEGVPFLTLPSTNRRRASALIKRVIDIGAAAVGLIVLSPLFAYCAIRIKRDSQGPVFFRQPRTGWGGAPFYVLKFRTMEVGADGRRGELLSMIAEEKQVMFKLEDDPRVTKFGSKLRRLSIDELPQLINVLRGNMSLVGPRPLPVDESNQVPEPYRARFKVRPGVTGPWQVLGRSAIPFEDMLKLDYTYVTNWSIGDDLKLMLRTVGAIAQRRGAY